MQSGPVHHVDLTVKMGAGQWVVPIHIKRPIGPQLMFSAQLTDTIEDLKAKIQDKRGLLLDRQRLKSKGQLLDEGKTLHDYSIQDNSTLLLIEPGIRRVRE